MQNCWRDYVEKHDEQRIVLSPWQQRLVWIDIIQSDIESQQNFLWNQNASVSQAINAWQICHDYEFDPEVWQQTTGDVNVFQRWYRLYLSVLKANYWLDQAQQINIMVANGYQPVSDQLVVLAQVLTPNQNKWIRHVESTSQNKIQFLQTQQQEDNFKTSIYDDFEGEITACANWACESIQLNSNQTIGIVVPGLRQQAKSVLTTFRRVFTPGFDLTDDDVELFELNTVDSLMQTGLVNSALNCLELLRFKFDYECFSHFLRDVFLQGRLDKRHGLSLLDIELRKFAQPQESLANLSRLCEHIDVLKPFTDQSLSTQLEKLRDLCGSLPQHASAAYWCNTFSTVLKLLGWPDISNLNLNEQKQLAQWNQMLAQMCTAGLIKQQFTLAQALRQLTELASMTPVQQSHQALIKIMDLEDISLAHFDSAWVTGLNDTVLPAKTQLNPLLPFSLQRNHQLPFSDNLSCMEQAKSTYTNIISLAGEIRFSYFKSDELSDFRVSPLISHLTINDANTETKNQFNYTPDLELEQYKDDMGLPQGVDPVTGGTYLLKAQSACPFQAYAAYRLKAEPLQSTEAGLDAAQKGVLVHDVLRRIWQQLGTQQTLNSLQQDDLTDLVNKNIDDCLGRLDLSQQLFSQVEKHRLTQLVNNWLEIEQQRKIPFSVVEQEHKSVYDLNAIKLQIKIDRIDELADGQRIIIDYKSGNADANQWIRDIDRLEDPQLPIYLLAKNQNVCAITFASLKNMKFDGLSKDDVGVDGVRDINKKNIKFLKQNQINDWSELEQHWRISIENLATEYIRGMASVTPRSPELQCKYCQRQSLCRLYQQQNYVGDVDASD